MSKQKIKELVIGTNNKGKLREIKSLLPNYIKIYSTSNFKLKSPAENGETFEENSLIKSKHFSKKTGLICLADDSGLEIDHLDKRPGIYSARSKLSTKFNASFAKLKPPYSNASSFSFSNLLL